MPLQGDGFATEGGDPVSFVVARGTAAFEFIHNQRKDDVVVFIHYTYSHTSAGEKTAEENA
ncbi:MULTISPECIES: hypothetical protein [Sediminibacillus]|uniref:hypothetical protein n=1 Tax=Sediminibacillus TaxID=482460 RepID=UPI0012960EE3|nr:hypothetical protein [Sediminibacillus terrae]